MTSWDTTPTEISIKHGGPMPGCVTAGLVVSGVGLLAVAAAIYVEATKLEALCDRFLP